MPTGLTYCLQYSSFFFTMNQLIVQGMALTPSLAFLGIPTLPAGRLLQVVSLGATATAQSVRLITPLSEGRCTLRLKHIRSII